jgi:hypothetical protein
MRVPHRLNLCSTVLVRLQLKNENAEPWMAASAPIADIGSVESNCASSEQVRTANQNHRSNQSLETSD